MYIEAVPGNHNLDLAIGFHVLKVIDDYYRNEYGQMARYSPVEYAYRAFLNNFPMNLPDQRRPHGGSNRDLLVAIERWERPLGRYLRGSPKARAEHSRLRLGQTGPEFFATIDRAVADEGISSQQMQHLQDVWDLSDQYQLASYKRVFPVYARLRGLGYNHMELTA